MEQVASGTENQTFVSKATNTAVEIESRWQAGPLSGSTRAVYDYDGCAKVWLTLDPCSTPVKQLQLRVPVALKEAFVMHTVTDQIREHFAGAIPGGEGEVWNSTGVARYKLPGPYLPYIFVGGSPRGLALFSDNDQGWISAEPAYSLERNSSAEALTVVAHLISENSPRSKAGGATWDKPRVITLGMMASPAKPQPTRPASSARRWWPQTASARDPRPAFRRDVATAELIGNSQVCLCISLFFSFSRSRSLSLCVCVWGGMYVRVCVCVCARVCASLSVSLCTTRLLTVLGNPRR